MLFGVRALVLMALAQVTMLTMSFHGAHAPLTLLGALTNPFSVLFAGATVLAGVLVVRAGILHGFARWALLVVGCYYGVVAVIPMLPLVAWASLVGAYFAIGWLSPAPLLVAGVSYVLHARSALIRQRLQAINEKW